MQNKIKAIIFGSKDVETGWEYLIKDDRYPEPYFESRFDVKYYNLKKYQDKDISDILYHEKNFDVIVTLYNQQEFEDSHLLWEEFFRREYPALFNFGPHTMLRWICIEECANPNEIGRAILDKFYYINQDFTTDTGKVSIITPCYNTSREMFMRLYDSIKEQTYNNLEWLILDDSDNGIGVSKYLEEIKDFRIQCLSNVTNHGNVGYNKRILGMIASGEFILEVDHDDELLPECLEKCAKAFEKYQDVGFVYSNGLELEAEGKNIFYGEGWGYYQGDSAEVEYKGNKLLANFSPHINEVSIRSIMSAPNHVRCWRKDVYNELNGHNFNYSIVDDFELIVRTFLKTKFCYVTDFLYIQHREQETTQYVRNAEIQRCNHLVKEIYDERIHNRILELGYEDTIWNESSKSSNLEIVSKMLPQKFNYVYEN